MSRIRSWWGGLGKRRRVGIIIFLCIVLIIVGRLLFSAPQPHVELPAEGVIPSPGSDFSVGSGMLAFHGITNTMLAALFTIIVLGVVCFLVTRRMKLVPRGLQNIVEGLVEVLINFVDDTAGKEYGRKFLPVIATIFIFVIANAWLALIPGFMTIGFWQWDAEKEVWYILPLFRGANTDINFPLALALVSFVFVEYWGIRSQGFSRYVRRFISVGGFFRGMGQIFKGKVKSGLGALLTGVVDVFVGFIEFISELVRILSLTVRLFGNMTAGEILILMMIFLLPWVVPSLFYGLELFLGFVQALIFCGLTLVFLVMAVTPREEHE